ncbi:MAG TPA: MFS transporter [Solirubrobacteraceae bacterium]
MSARSLVRRFVLLRALRWLPLGIGLPFFVLLPIDRGLGLGEVGVMWAAHSIVAIICEVPSGGLADSIGRRPTLLMGGTLTAAALAGLAVATGLVGFMLATATLAAGRALISGSLEAWFVDELRTTDAHAPLHRPLAAGSTAEALGTAFGAAVGGVIPLLITGLPEHGDAALVRLSVPFLAAAGAALVYVVAVAAFVREPRRVAGGTWRDTATATRDGLRAARASRNVRLVLGVAIIVGLVMSTTELLWQPRLEQLVGEGNRSWLFGALAATSMAAAAAGSASSPWIGARAGNRRVYAGALVAAAATVALLAAAQATVLFCAVYLLYFWALGLADPMHFAVLHESIEGDTRATVASAEGLATQVGGIGGNLMLAPLAATAGLGLAWGIAAAAAVGGALLASATRPARAPARPRPRPAAPSGVA